MDPAAGKTVKEEDFTSPGRVTVIKTPDVVIDLAAYIKRISPPPAAADAEKK